MMASRSGRSGWERFSRRNGHIPTLLKEDLGQSDTITTTEKKLVVYICTSVN